MPVCQTEFDAAGVLLNLLALQTGYEHPVDTVVADLLACLDDPALALLQWTEAFNVVQARSHPDQQELCSRERSARRVGGTATTGPDTGRHALTLCHHPALSLLWSLRAPRCKTGGALVGATEACGAWQTRLPGELASTLEGVASEYEADLLVGPAGSDSEEDVAAWGLFPARQLLEAINAAIQVLPRCRALCSCRAVLAGPLHAALRSMLLNLALRPMTAVLTGCAGLVA